MKVSPIPPGPEVPISRKLLTLQIPPAQKVVRRESIRKKKKKAKRLCPRPLKEEVLRKPFIGKLAQWEVLYWNITHTLSVI